MPNSEYFIQLEDQYGAHNYHPLDVVLTKGEGVWVYDVDGNKYLDCLSAYSALNQGHNHPKIRQAMIDQLGKITLTSRAFRNDQLGLFYKKLSDMTGYEMSLPMNSGAEAVETAIKVARKWAYQVKGVPRYKAEIIVAEGNFHGRTTTIISFTTTEFYKHDFGPFTPGFPTVPYGDLEAIKLPSPPTPCAIMLEPLQGETGSLHRRMAISEQLKTYAKRITFSLSQMKFKPVSAAQVPSSPRNMKASIPISPSSAKPSQAASTPSRQYWQIRTSWG